MHSLANERWLEGPNVRDILSYRNSKKNAVVHDFAVEMKDDGVMSSNIMLFVVSPF